MKIAVLVTLMVTSIPASTVSASDLRQLIRQEGQRPNTTQPATGFASKAELLDAAKNGSGVFGKVGLSTNTDVAPSIDKILEVEYGVSCNDSTGRNWDMAKLIYSVTNNRDWQRPEQIESRNKQISADLRSLEKSGCPLPYIEAVKAFVVEYDDALSGRDHRNSEERDRIEMVAARKDAQRIQKMDDLKECRKGKPFTAYLAATYIANVTAQVDAAKMKLKHDDEVAQISGFQDATARRAAGETIAQGTQDMSEAFEEYRAAGGSAGSTSELLQKSAPTDPCE